MNKINEHEQRKKKVLELITISGILGMSLDDIHKSIKLSKNERNIILMELKHEKLIYYSIGSAKFKLVGYATYQEKRTMEWCAG